MKWLRQMLARPVAGEGRLQVVDRVALSPQHSLHLVRLGKRLILVGRSPSGLTRLGTAETPESGEPR